MKTNGKKISFSIRTKLIITFIALTTVIMSILGVVIFSNWINTAHQVTSDLSKQTNSDIALHVSDFLNEPLTLNESNAQFITNNYVDMLDQVERERFFVLSLQNLDVQVLSFAYGTVDGEYFGARRSGDTIEIMRNDASTGGHSWYYTIKEDLTADERVFVTGLFDPRTRPWYTEAVNAGHTIFSSVYEHFVLEDLAISIVTPIYDEQDNLKGVLATHMILSNISTFLNDELSNNNGSGIIIDRNSGQLIANSLGIANFEVLENNSVHRTTIEEIENTDFYRAYQGFSLNQTENFEFRNNMRYSYYSIREVSENGIEWLIITFIPQGLLFTQILQNVYWLIAIFIASIAMMIIVYQVLMNKFFQPVNELVKISNEYAIGSFKNKIAISGQNEFSRLAYAFNSMADRIKDIVEGLEQTVFERTEHLELVNEKLMESEQRFKILHDASFSGLAIHDKGTILECNQGLSDITGYELNELIGMDLISLISLEYRELVMKNIDEGYEKPYEVLGIKKNKEFFPLRLEARNIPYQGRQVRVAEFRDITKSKKIEMDRDLEFKNRIELINKMQLGFAEHEMIYNEYGEAIDYKYLFVNDGFCKLTGWKKEDIEGKLVTEVYPQVEKKRIERYQSLFTAENTFTFNTHFEKEDAWYELKAYKSDTKKFITLFFDITERIKYEQNLIEVTNRYHELAKQSRTITWETNQYGLYVYVSSVIQDVLGYNPDEIINIKHCYDLLSNDFRMSLGYNFSSDSVITIPASIEKKCLSKDGREVWLLSTSMPIYNEQNELIGYRGSDRDITHEKVSELKLVYLKNHDPLTGLYNRDYYLMKLKEFDYEQRYPIATTLLDIDGLKVINDAFGYEAGNQALIMVAEKLKTICHHDRLLFRIGGDEFAIVGFDVKMDDFNRKNQNIEMLNEDLTFNGVSMFVSYGRAIKMSSDGSIEKLIQEAENEMFKMKSVQGQSVRSRAIMSIIKTLTNKYSEEEKHSSRVSDYCNEMGVALNYSHQKLLEIKLAGMLHDIGKISIPDAIIRKPGKLNDEEWAIMKSHTVVGYEILSAADQYSDLAKYARSHHERYDGKGYPDGLTGDQIPEIARIICIVDAYEAMTSDRVYRKALGSEEAITELRKWSGTQFDPELVKVFLEKVLKKSWNE
jgi:diguanylate cyclase (GGDEF)-like protein/PAS domain S-box-containing protein